MSDNSTIKSSGPEIVHRTSATAEGAAPVDRAFGPARLVAGSEEAPIRSTNAAAAEMASRYVDPTTGAVDVPAAAKAFGTSEEAMKEIVAPRLALDSPEAKRAATQAIAAVFSPDEWTAYQVWGSTGPEDLVKMHVAVWQEAYTNEERAKELSAAMNDPRYGQDVAYTRAIEDKVGRSKFI